MPTHSSPSSDPSLASLIGGIINDAKDLLLHEFVMAKLEMQSELRKTKAAAISFAIGAGIAVVGGLLLILMLVHLLDAFTAIPLWGCYGIMGGGATDRWAHCFKYKQTNCRNHRCCSQADDRNPQGECPMDQRTDDLQQNIAETRHDIEETRASMSEKLELLEERVRDTLEETKIAVDDIVENVKDTVDETVDAVKETVTGAKSTVENIVENVKGTMDDTVTKVKQSFDLRYQVEQHPWLMLGGSVVAGSILASFMHPGRETRHYSYYADSRLNSGHEADNTSATGVYTGAGLYAGTGEENATASQEHSKYTDSRTQRGWGSTLGQLQEEFDIAKGVVTGAVISTVMGTLQEMIRQNIPSMASYFDNAVHRVAKKWGVEPDKSATNHHVHD